MKRTPIALGALAVGLIGFGIWLGRASSTATVPATPSPAPQPVAATEPAPRAHVQARPALVRRGQPAPGLAQDLASADPKVRRAAVAEVAQSGDPDVGVLLAASRDADVDVAITATRALGSAYATGQVPVSEMIARATDRSVSPRVRLTTLDGLAAVGNPEAARILVDLLAHGGEVERRAAAGLLANQDPAIAVPALIDALADADEYVRANALAALVARSRGRDFGSDASAWRAWWQARSR